MKVKIFSYLSTEKMEDEVNAFLSRNKKIKIIKILQSESALDREGYAITISIFYEEI